MNQMSLGRQCLAEFVGTYILVFFGVGCVHCAVLTTAPLGLWQVSVVWAVAVSLAIYATGAVSGAHINPAMTIAFAVFRGFPARRVGPYIGAQVAGAFAGAATLYGLFGGLLRRFEAGHALVRGEPGSVLSAMCYGEYFPNPGAIGIGPDALAAVTPWQAMVAEGIGTAFLAAFVFALTDRRHPQRPGSRATPLCIGLALALCISVIAPLTQAGFNPARDFGPRFLAWLVGWGRVAIPGPRGGFFTVYVLAPVLGALVGAAAYQFLIRPARPAPTAATVA